MQLENKYYTLIELFNKLENSTVGWNGEEIYSPYAPTRDEYKKLQSEQLALQKNLKVINTNYTDDLRGYIYAIEHDHFEWNSKKTTNVIRLLEIDKILANAPDISANNYDDLENIYKRKLKIIALIIHVFSNEYLQAKILEINGNLKPIPVDFWRQKNPPINWSKGTIIRKIKRPINKEFLVHEIDCGLEEIEIPMKVLRESADKIFAKLSTDNTDIEEMARIILKMMMLASPRLKKQPEYYQDFRTAFKEKLGKHLSETAFEERIWRSLCSNDKDIKSSPYKWNKPNIPNKKEVNEFSPHTKETVLQHLLELNNLRNNLGAFN